MPHGRKYRPQLGGLHDGIADNLQRRDQCDLCTSNPYVGWYGQDNWRLSTKLTVNFGMRMEYEFGLKERYNRFIAGFDPTATLPITALAQAAYAKTPVPELAASAFSAVGGSLYTGAGTVGTRFPAGQLMFLPRIGFAYQLTPKTVLRGGYGIYYDTLNAQNQSPDQSGFSRTTTNSSSNDFRTDVAFRRSARRCFAADQSLPGAQRRNALRPAGRERARIAGQGRQRLDLPRSQLPARPGAAMAAGGAAPVRREDGRIGRLRGNVRDNVRITQKAGRASGAVLGFRNTRNNAIATNLNQNVTNPFYIGNFSSLQSSDPVIYQALASRSFFTSPTIRKNQLLRPFSQMNGLSETGGYGETKGDSVEVVFTRRFAGGFTFNANFTGLVERDRDFFNREFDPTPSWELSNNGTPWRFTVTGI